MGLVLTLRAVKGRPVVGLEGTRRPSVSERDSQNVSTALECLPDTLRGISHLQRNLTELQKALVHGVPEDIAITMANLQGCVDWFQVTNGLELNSQRIEAEYYRYEEIEEETTVREWPPQ